MKNASAEKSIPKPLYLEQLQKGISLDRLEYGLASKEQVRQFVSAVKAHGLDLDYDPATNRIIIRKP